MGGFPVCSHFLRDVDLREAKRGGMWGSAAKHQTPCVTAPVSTPARHRPALSANVSF